MPCLVKIGAFFCPVFLLCAWQAPAEKPSFTGTWQLDAAKSKGDTKGNLVWKIDHKSGDISIEEVSDGKAISTAKCTIAKPCQFEEAGRKMSAMTYFLGDTLVQIRSAEDNSTAIKRQLKMDTDGTMHVELITIVPADKTEMLVFAKQKVGTALAKQ